MKSANFKEKHDEFEFNQTMYKYIEIQLATQFITNANIKNSNLLLHSCILDDAIKSVILDPPLEQKKAILLYCHKSQDPLSKTFCEMLEKTKVSDLINESFYLLAWDIEEESFHVALTHALENYDLSKYISFQKASLSIIVPLNKSLKLFSHISGKQSEKNLLKNIQEAEIFYKKNINEQIELAVICDGVETANCFGPKEYQQLMAELLGDRDYDSFDFNEHDLLKRKLGYAMFGQNMNEHGEYEENQKKKIDKMFKVILDTSNKFVEFKDRIEISFIYNCTEPLPNVKAKRGKKLEDYNPKADFTPIPLFVLRKCISVTNPCRIFIDDTGRVYNSWQNYKENNKLPECTMLLPRNGRYEFDDDGKVILEPETPSPACGIETKILRGTDIATTATGIASSVLVGVAAIPAITVAPAVVATGLGIGIGVGIYGIGRSAFHLYDRSKHKESLSFANSDARSAYLSIVAGSLGFVGAGANMAISQLALRGVTIGGGVNAAVSTISIMNLGASGVSFANSGYEILDQWGKDSERPSLLSIVQISASVLFFGNVVFDIQTAETLIDRTQLSVLKEYNESLRSNQFSKKANQLTKEIETLTDGIENIQAEIISPMQKISSADQIFLFISENKHILSTTSVAITSDEIRFNDITINKTVLTEFIKYEIKKFASPSHQEFDKRKQLSKNDFLTIQNEIEETSEHIPIKDIQHVLTFSYTFLNRLESEIQMQILIDINNIFKQIIPDVRNNLKQIYPGVDLFVKLLNFIISFYQKACHELEEQYQIWLKSMKNAKYFNCIFLAVEDIDKFERLLIFFNHIFEEQHFQGRLINEKILMKYFYAWYVKTCVVVEEMNQQFDKRLQHSKERAVECVDCDICKGKYFKLVKI